MSEAQIQHINTLLNNDDLVCLQQIKIIKDSDYSEEAKNILSGFFRQRSELNQQILSDNGYYEGRNINTQTPG